jgi:hypothetical protein
MASKLKKKVDEVLKLQDNEQSKLNFLEQLRKV